MLNHREKKQKPKQSYFMACLRIKTYFKGLQNLKEKQNMKLSRFIKINFLTV